MKKTLFQKKSCIKSMLGILICVLFFGFNSFISEAAEGKVTAETAKIREEADTDSEAIGSTSKGKTVDIVGAAKDSSGMVWYKIHNGNNTYGYIRSDLVETAETIEVTETVASSESSSSESASSENVNKPADTVPVAITQQQATISQSEVRIRSGASTQHEAIGSLPQGTNITLIGEASDSSGNKWYQMTCDYNGNNIKGYIRSDLITIGVPAEETEEGTESENTEDTESTEGTEGENTEATPVEGEVSSEPEYNDYEIVYNENQYWLYNNIDGTMVPVENLLSVVDSANESNEKLQDEIKSNKIIIVILAVLILVLVVAVTIMIFKFRDLYYEEYEDEEDEEDEEEEPVPIKRRQNAVSEEPAQRKEKLIKSKQSQGAELQATERRRTEKRRPEQDSATEGQSERKQPEKRRTEKKQQERTVPEKGQNEKKQKPRKAQNFLLEDDEFEFEFLNIDDKKL